MGCFRSVLAVAKSDRDGSRSEPGPFLLDVSTSFCRTHKHPRTFLSYFDTDNHDNFNFLASHNSTATGRLGERDDNSNPNFITVRISNHGKYRCLPGNLNVDVVDVQTFTFRPSREPKADHQSSRCESHKGLLAAGGVRPRWEVYFGGIN